MKRFIAVFLIALLVLLAGCGSAELAPEAKDIQGEWAYIHSDDVASLVLKPNGKAVFENENYTYNCEDGRLILTDSHGDQLSMRYFLEDGKLILYKQTTYTCSSPTGSNGVVGLWEAPKDHWSFEFTADGTFREDGYFPGFYTVNETDGTIKLVYNDKFEDTVIYYSISGNELTVEYPWPMVPVVK